MVVIDEWINLVGLIIHSDRVPNQCSRHIGVIDVFFRELSILDGDPVSLPRFGQPGLVVMKVL
jgi:hypothetical protein